MSDQEAEVLICSRCYEDKTKVDGCIPHLKRYPDGSYYEPSRAHHNEPSGRCHSCNARHGSYHHAGCFGETCPRCGRALMSCGCLTGATI